MMMIQTSSPSSYLALTRTHHFILGLSLQKKGGCTVSVSISGEIFLVLNSTTLMKPVITLPVRHTLSICARSSSVLVGARYVHVLRPLGRIKPFRNWGQVLKSYFCFRNKIQRPLQALRRARLRRRLMPDYEAKKE